MQTLIVGDIGGTNARFALATQDDQGVIRLSQMRDFSTADFSDFDLCFDLFLSQLASDDWGQSKPVQACIAVAGPVGDLETHLTNVSWSLNPGSLCKQFNLQHVEVLNDFAALACSLPYLQADDLKTLQAPGELQNESFKPKAVIGPGTGLGVAALVHSASGWIPIATEGGHRSFSPETDIEFQISQSLCDKDGYLAVEDLLSGSGLCNIYESLGEIQQQTVQPLQPYQITEVALSGKSELAKDALNIFFGVLGSVCGDAALSYGATGGVYIGGGILPQLQDFVLQSEFLKRFNNKGSYRQYVNPISVRLITRKNPALIGAAAWLLQKDLS